jgi:hypothetical protein
MGSQPQLADEDYPASGESADAYRGRQQRTAPRTNLLIRAAKIVSASGDHLCVLRDVSEGGVKAHLLEPLPTNERLSLELVTGERFAIEKVWQEGERAGFRFIEPVSFAQLIAEAPAGRSKRSLRLRFDEPLLIHANGHRLGGQFRDISQYGASLSCADHLALGQRVRLEWRFQGPIDARVRWRRNPHYGLAFEQTFRLEELAKVVSAARLVRSDIPSSG